MPTPAAESGPPKGIFRTLWDDVHKVRADLQRRGLSASLSASLTELESFYLDDTSRRQLAGMNHVRAWVRRILWLLRSLLLKLTPTRRLLLALSIVLLMSTVNYDSRRGFTGSVHLPTAGAVFIAIVLMLELKDKLVARNELVAGRAVQLALMPPEMPAIPGWDVWLYTQPANDVGGDLVDHLGLGDGRHSVCLGDVAGKALPAALLMVKLQATLRALAPENPSLDALGARTNAILFRDGLPNRFATLFYTVLDETSGRVRYLNAGHLLPLVVRSTGIDALPGGSMALGMIETASFHEQQVVLADGDALVVFSDGVTEASNAAEDFFGDERLIAATRSAAGQSAKAIGDAVLQSLAVFVGETRPSDDVSIVVIRRRA